jgi:hypothetical protein
MNRLSGSRTHLNLVTHKRNLSVVGTRAAGSQDTTTPMNLEAIYKPPIDLGDALPGTLEQ